jgi:FkbM family methyltransferase
MIYLKRILTMTSHQGKRRALIQTYLKLKLAAFLKLFPSPLGSSISFLGFDVHFFDLPAVISLFEEIFINSDYSFKTSSEEPSIIDGGSNIGISVLFFKWLYPACRIVAFEADEDTYRLLRQNIEVNALDRVQTHNAAVCGTEGTIDFYHQANRPGAHVNSILRKDGLPVKKTNAVLLSKYIEGQVDLLKLDIEGSEMAVLEELAAAGKLIQVRQIIMEYHHHIDTKVDEMSKALAILEQHGFGYQISGYQQRPFQKETTEFILLYAYRK